MEDILQIRGPSEQIRHGQSMFVHGVDVPYAVGTTVEMTALDVTRFTHARVYVSANSYKDYLYDASSTAGFPADNAPGSWRALVSDLVVDEAFKSFDSLTSAVAFVTANPDAVERVSTASYRNEAECLALSIPYPDGGAADYVVVAGGTGAISQGYWDAGTQQLELIKPLVVTPELWGMSGVSPAIDTEAYQNAIIYSSANKIKLVVKKDFIQNSNITHDGDIEVELNANITITSAVSEGFGTTQTQRGSDSSLTSDAAAGSNTLSVNTAAMTGLKEGDFILVESIEVFDPRTNSLFGEGARVKSFTASSIVLDRPIVFSYTTANSGKVSAFKTHQVKITGSGGITGDATTNQWAFFLRNCVNSTIGGGLKSSGTALGGFRYMDSLDSEVDRVDCENHQFVTLGYATTVFGASRNIKVKNVTSIDTRHAFTTNNPASPSAGIPIDIYVSDGVCNGTVSSGDGWDTHAASWNVNFIRCNVNNSSASGFNWEAASGSIVDCEESNSTNEGYRARNETFQSGVFEFRNNNGEGCAENGVQLGSPNAVGAVPFAKVIVDGNEYTGAGQNGMWLNTILGDEVFSGANYASGSASSDYVFDSDNLRFTNIFFDTSANVAAASTVTFDPRVKVMTITTAGTIDNINGMIEGQSYYMRKSSNGNVVTLTETGNIVINPGTTLDLASPANPVLLLRIGSDVLVNQL